VLGLGGKISEDTRHKIYEIIDLFFDEGFVPDYPEDFYIIDDTHIAYGTPIRLPRIARSDIVDVWLIKDIIVELEPHVAAQTER